MYFVWGGRGTMVHEWRSEHNSGKLVLTLHHVGQMLNQSFTFFKILDLMCWICKSRGSRIKTMYITEILLLPTNPSSFYKLHFIHFLFIFH